MRRFGLYAPAVKDFLTYGGRILVHTNKDELEFLFNNVRVRALPQDIPTDQTLPIQLHPELTHIRFPLVRSDFRR